MVIALERSYFPSGTEKRGGCNEKNLQNISIATPWNHIEAAMAYSRHLPIFVITEEGLKSEGLLEPGYDWFVLSVPLDPSRLNTPQFNGILSDWKSKIFKYNSSSVQRINAGEMSVAELVGSLKPVQLWSLLIALAGFVGGAFTLGLKFQEIAPKHNNVIHQSRPLPWRNSPMNNKLQRPGDGERYMLCWRGKGQGARRHKALLMPEKATSAP